MITLGSGVFSQNWGKHGEVYVTSCGYKTTKTDPALPNTLWGSVFGFLWAFWGLNTPRNNFGWLGWCTTWSTLLFLPRCGLEEIDASYNPTSALALWGGSFCCCSRGVVVVVVVQRVLGNHQGWRNMRCWFGQFFFLRMLQGGLQWMSPNCFFLNSTTPETEHDGNSLCLGVWSGGTGYIMIYRYVFTYSKASTMPNRQLLLKTSLPDVGKQRKCRGFSRLSYGTLWRCHMPDYTETAACYTAPQRNAVFHGLIFCRCWMMFGVPIQPYLLPPINQGDRIETWPKKACNNKQKTVQWLRSWWLGGRLGQGAAALSVVNTDNHILDLPPPNQGFQWQMKV